MGEPHLRLVNRWPATRVKCGEAVHGDTAPHKNLISISFNLKSDIKLLIRDVSSKVYKKNFSKHFSNTGSEGNFEANIRVIGSADVIASF